MPTYPINFFSQPFAASGDKNIIGETSVTQGRANLPEGFPPITATPIAKGGIAPNRLDFNGILYMLSAMAFWQQSGGMWQYNSDLDYTPPAIVFYAGKYWQCVQANSASAPVTPGTDSAYWQDLSDFLGTLKSLTLTGDATGTGTVANGTMTVNVSVNQADQADKLTSPMTLTFNGQVTGSVSFDGSENATVSLTIQGFVPTSGGTITGPITWNGKSLINSVNGVAADSTGNVTISTGTAPNYAAAYSVGTSGTASADGYIFVHFAGWGGTYYLNIGGMQIINESVGEHYLYANLFPVKKGQSWSASGSGVYVRFVPAS